MMRLTKPTLQTLAACLIALATSDAAAQSACFTELPCLDAGKTHRAVIFPDHKLEQCEAYKRQARAFPALREAFERLGVSSAQCTGQLEIVAAQLDAERVRADALRSELDARWPWYVWAGVGAGVVVAGELALFFALR